MANNFVRDEKANPCLGCDKRNEVDNEDCPACKHFKTKPKGSVTFAGFKIR